MTASSHITTDRKSDESAREKILDSAIKIFSTNGFGGARLREIADHAGVNHAMIKYYFGSKDELWRDAVSFLFARQSAELANALRGINTDDRKVILYTTVNSMIRYCARHPEHARLVMQATMTPGPHLDWVLEQMQAHASVQLGPAFGGGVRAPATQTTIALRYLIYGAINTVFTLEHEAKRLFDIDTTSNDFVDFFAGLAIKFLTPAIEAAYQELTGETADNALPAAPILSSQQTDKGLELRILIPSAE